jgi:hypothetical protein
MDTIDDAQHEHVALAKKVAQSVLYGTINEYEKLHGQADLQAFLSSIPGVELQDGGSDEA